MRLIYAKTVNIAIPWKWLCLLSNTECYKGFTVFHKDLI